MPTITVLSTITGFHQTHKKKNVGEHSSDGWYLKTSPEHYRYHIVFVKATRSKCISDMVYFKHKYLTQPTVTPTDAIIKAYQDLTLALKGINNTKGNAQLSALKQIQEVLKPTN